ncbi:MULTISPECIES: cupin domain-containing protein [unclassified Sphingobium]|uniref:cupin domain-containing protein n=1 Tax=unclassified Sphingobium TaxID=2611147 RepID=UPI002224C6C5|nr:MULTISPECIES: cupin domain-containing protein [unclassified Sphingobium]MCW2380767.1 putative cupin superfamily sugar epimerase [Sphingobium sp. B2D3B]MCW2399125.1 putative cupin superfamily sugar epimerase [Sphingobium sp. B2D3C]
MTDSTARALIDRLALQPHPEGGWYRETWRAEAAPGERAGATAILFLLEPGQRSHWHKVDASEAWLWHAGHALNLSTAPGDEGPVTALRLGGDVLAGEIPQHVISPHHWQAAEADRGWALVSCIVTPGFDFAGFTLAPLDWAPGCAPGDPSAA